ncbi:DUF1194 domain-containing protein [Wenxinia marina]|uniref:VWFA domain-containing protein n=1 Tax=Wenxinia marina DSM 24838 TaxID=1123501 RepID=A0A0D0Q4V8_9RHOB|nr:DUF1194 domain-containing protein [Wenxinia marina]KIQ69549.1 hypothetical protein Wenmar_01913 [Wenxinia marina DSM 24838]GGL59246.1 hypothetical protein GCM10011392_12190 [Wenxinia marina]
MRALLALLALLGPASARACETALLLAIDVSQSVDEAEFRLQVDGMADAMRDPEVAEALVQGEVALAVMQWSGAERQEMSIPWTRIASHSDVERLSDAARAIPRAFVMSDTAPGDALAFALGQFGPVADCERRVIDVSGDGTPNAGRDVRHARIDAQRAGVTINAIAIESLGLAITNFYERAVITADGFVMTARGHRDYPMAIRRKILREVSRVLG